MNFADRKVKSVKGIKGGYEMENKNMELWNKVCETDPKVTKAAKIGELRINSINPQSQRKKATEVFGPYGIEWGIIPESERFEFNAFGETTLVSYFAILFYNWKDKTGKIPINACIKIAYKTSKGYIRIDDEYTKKVQTNALTKGLSTLGFNSDVFEGWYDDCKYVQQMQEKFYYINSDEVKTIEDLIENKKIDKAKFLQYMNVDAVEKIPKAEFNKGSQALRNKK